MKGDMDKILVFFHTKYQGNWDEIYGALSRKEKVDLDEARRNYEELSKDYRIITLIDEGYPDYYKTDYFKPPFVIFELKTENTLC